MVKKNQTPKASQAEPPSGLSRGWKWLLSGLIALHLLAVVAEPFRFFTRSRRGTSPASDPARIWLAPYIEFAYLNHGYFFLCPEPGPSHLMECQLTMPDNQTASLTFPDKHKQWPRLLYHRHFMLAEFLHQLHVPPFHGEVAGGDDRFAQDWQDERALFERVRQSLSGHVVAKFGALEARIERIEHRLPSDDEVFRERLPLDSPTLYVTLPDAPLEFDVPRGQTVLRPGASLPFSSELPLGRPLLPPGWGVLRNPPTTSDTEGARDGATHQGLRMDRQPAPAEEIKP